ncbi:Major Facilitator Superfamily transporter [Halobacteroides halobius DSM 5150]|uniref:Major Facilitator Superfamily transporter n=1 Tax=Halobacteroides halobius (strain ATCC 35273 / DSM 5150 / MD-1) TaxID=748449 RepID=L0KBQ2_HALHC|nr:MFS transporter [Halobacteroides halobius]AGB41518.1 Major Facilitator Superfamily transporter [Halobacteroides halobius DSM 5150]
MYFKVFNLFFYMGIAALTYLNVYFKNVGLTSSQIGFINSVAKGVSLVILPLWGMISDYYKISKRLLIIAVLGAMLASLTFLLTDSFYMIMLVMSVFFIFWSPIIPLADAQLLGYLGKNGNQYGKYRVWGSLGYTLLVPIIGYLIEQTTATNLFYYMGVIFFISLFTVRKLPTSNVTLEIANVKDFKKLLKRGKLLKFILFIFFINLTLSTNNIFFPLYVIDHGGGETLIGLALMIAAASEMFIFHYSDGIIERFDLKYIFLISALAFALRWFLLASFPISMVFLGSQLLHSITFGLLHAVSVDFINLICGDKFKATGQNLYATTKGISSIVGSSIGGIIYGSLGGSILYFYLSLVALVTGLIYFTFLNSRDKVVAVEN